jgi:hypothetical protein
MTFGLFLYMGAEVLLSIGPQALSWSANMSKKPVKKPAKKKKNVFSARGAAKKLTAIQKRNKEALKYK